MSEVTPISREAISTFLEKADLYHLLNEPRADEYYDPMKKSFRIFRGRT